MNHVWQAQRLTAPVGWLDLDPQGGTWNSGASGGTSERGALPLDEVDTLGSEVDTEGVPSLRSLGPNGAWPDTPDPTRYGHITYSYFLHTPGYCLA